jgi:hypothetical protein
MHCLAAPSDERTPGSSSPVPTVMLATHAMRRGWYSSDLHARARGGAAAVLGLRVLSAAVSRFVCAVIEVRFWLLPVTCVLACRAHGTHEPPIGDGRAAAACPSYLDLELDGGDSRFDPGWKGTAHGVGLPSGSRTSVKIDECDAECRRCTFHGPVRGDPTKVVNQRCLKDVSRVCGGPTDPDCGAMGPCRFVFPPIPSNVGFNTCAIAYFEPLMGDAPAVQGVMDLATGESDMPVLNLQLALGLANCVNCLGDTMPFDGVRGGKCGGTGAMCDVNGTGTMQTGSTSFDCPPSLTNAVTIALGTNGTSTSSVGWTMDPTTRPMCTASTAMGKHCWCGMCNNGMPCTSGKDCPDGFCGAKNPPGNTNIAWSVANNNCTGTCNWDAATQSGRCSNDASIKCFPDSGPMIATGLAQVGDGFYITQLANLVCMPSFNVGTFLSAAVDQLGGFPGPFLFQSRFRVQTRSGP